jgi:hypothetical protein
MKNGNPKDIFPGLKPSGAPPGLRERVLTAARETAVTVPRRMPWDQRLWENRGLRLAWIGTVVVLLAANAFFAVQPAPEVASTVRPQVIEDVATEEEDLLRMIRPRDTQRKALAEQMRLLDEALTNGNGNFVKRGA